MHTPLLVRSIRRTTRQFGGLRSVLSRRSLLLLACCGLLACSNRLPPEFIGLQAASQIDRLTAAHGTLEDPVIRRELDDIAGRISRAIPAERRLVLEVLLVNSGEKFAYAPGGGFILVSRGLIERLETEAAVAFVIAHEAAHDILGHTQDGASQNADDRKAYERDADRYALGLLAAAGYDPNYAIKGIADLYNAEDRFRPQEHYPSMVERSTELQAALAASNWAPPGTISRRSYLQFRQYLASLPAPGA